MSIYQDFRPTYLYIKQHTVTGKLYFGKTIKNPEKYHGSGTHWKLHIRNHGIKYVTNLWYELFTNRKELTNFALSFSKEMNIVESDQWLNLMNEDGLCGGATIWGISHHNFGKPSFRKGKTNTKEHNNLIRESHLGSKNPMYGKPGTMTGKFHSDATKEKCRLSHLGLITGPQNNPAIKINCPHCNLLTDPGNANRWHFDNCKLKI